MRNLKRALSLALASVMLLGMMVVGSSAKGIDDFTDKAEIVNQDAVAVTSAIGMFEGYEDGSFGPENVVTRAEMAVIICTMLYGAGVNVNQFAETSVFTDVPAWAQGYVNLCSSLGIVAGVGDGKFDPNATVTTAQAVLMLCRALGYFQSAADFGDNWMLAATAKGTALGLYGDLKLAANEGLTRDNVAELVFNALTKAVPVQYNELLGVYYNENQGIIYSLEFNYLQTLGYKNFDLVYKTNTETIYGRPATTWGTGSYNVKTEAGSTSKTDNLTEDGGLITSLVRMLDKDQIITVANIPDYVYTEDTDSEDVYKDLGKSVCTELSEDKKDGYDWTVFVNGKEWSGKDDEKIVLPESKNSDTYRYTADGTVTEIYIDDADQTVTVVEINNYIGQVTKVKEDADGEYITVKPLSKGVPALDDKTFYVEGFAEDDYVVFTVDQNDDDEYVIAEAFAPETASGEVSRVEKDDDSKDTYLKLDDGTKYPYSYSVDRDSDERDHMVYDLDSLGDRTHPTLGDDYTLYLDPNGYVLGFAKDEGETKYLYVEDSDEELKDWVAKVVLTDGTNPKVDVKEDLKKTPDEIGDKIAWTQKADADKYGWETNIDGKVWKYSVSDSGMYTLTYVASKDMDNAEINNGKAYVSDGNNEFIVDKKTVFVDVDGEKAYIGYDEVPDVSEAKLAYVLDNKVAEVVFIIEGEFYDNANTYFMLSKTDRESFKHDDDKYWDFSKAYVNGEKQSQLYVAYDALNNGDDLKAGVLYKVLKTVDEEYITEIEEVALGNNLVNAVGDDAFWITKTQDKSVKYDVDEETVFVYVDNTKSTKFDISEGNLNDMEEYDASEKTNTYVTVVKDANDHETARLVYIVEKSTVENFDVAIEVENAVLTVNGKEYTENATLNVEKGTKLTWTAKAKPGYTLTTAASGELVVNAAGKIEAKATVQADGRKVIVNGEAQADKTGIAVDAEAVVTLTAKAGYTITSVSCAQASKIDTKTWTVTIPAGTGDVTINVDADPDEYTVTYPQYWYDNNSGDQRELTVTKGATKIVTDGKIDVELTTPWVGATSYEVKVTGATGEFTKVNGWAQETDHATIKDDAMLKLLQNEFGTIYSDADCKTPVAGSISPSGTTVYWVTKEAKAPVWSGTISNPTGDVTVEFVWKG